MKASVTATAHQVSVKALGWLHEHHERGTLPVGVGTDISEPKGVYKALGELSLASSLCCAKPSPARTNCASPTRCWTTSGTSSARATCCTRACCATR